MFLLMAASGAQPAGAAGAATTLVGQFDTLWGDSAPGSNQPARTIFSLTSAKGQRHALDVSESLLESAGGIVALNGRQVSVEVNLPSTPDGATAAGAPSGDGPLPVTSIQAVDTPSGVDGAAAVGAAPAAVPSTAVTGSQPWAVVLCKFKDNPSEPVDTAYVDGMFGASYPGLDHYWREVSNDRISVAGSGVVNAWTEMPHDVSYYSSFSTNTMLTMLRDDCLATAKATVDFRSYVGINLFFNASFGPYAWGGAQTINLNGVTRTWRITWMPPWGFTEMATLAHEMGHGFGMPHSNFDRGIGDTSPYDNYWDVMSAPWGTVIDPSYGVLPQDTNAYHLNGLVGWIDDAYRFTVPAAGVFTVDLERTDLPTTGNTQVIQIPVDGSSTHFYVVEARQKAAGTYDASLPSTGVIIHEVITSRTEPAWLMAAPGTIDSSAAGAVWTAGETFTAGGEFSVTVDSLTGTGAVVTVMRFVPPASIKAIAPTKLVNLTSPEFQWNVSLGATDYQLVVKQGRTVVFDQTYTAAEAACTDTCSVSGSSTPPGPALPDGKYTFTVTPLNSFAAGRVSRRLVFVVDTTPPDPPVLRSPIEGAVVRAIPYLMIRRPATAYRYRFALVDSAGDCDTTLPTIDEQRSTRYKPASLDLGPVIWCAQARDKAGNWSGWNAADFVLAPPIPAAPRQVSPANGAKIASGTPTFEWQAVSGDGITYEIEVSLSSRFLTPPMDGGPSSDLFWTPLTPLPVGTYYWHVRALNVDGEPGKWSRVRKLIVTAGP